MSETVLCLPEFSINGEVTTGVIPLVQLERLCRHLPTPPDGQLVYRLAGGKDADSCLFLTVAMSAQLPLICQRCLEVFIYPLTVNRRFWLRGGALPKVGSDVIGEELEGGKMSVIEFLTDELLLSLPPAPAHALSACKAAVYLSN